jgi:acyl-CoA reductase-like NAD-dependent aldehyde dehydrogenase
MSRAEQVREGTEGDRRHCRDHPVEYPAEPAVLEAVPGVDRIAFTGSTATGKHLAKVAADRLARVSLELGGKSPSIADAGAVIHPQIKQT